jgi:hypothetical protein
VAARRGTKYWLSNVDKKISFRELVDIAKMRWRIERDYQDLARLGLPQAEAEVGASAAVPRAAAATRAILILRNMIISSGSGMRVLLHPVPLVEMPVAIVHPRPLVQITLRTGWLPRLADWHALTMSARRGISAGLSHTRPVLRVSAPHPANCWCKNREFCLARPLGQALGAERPEPRGSPLGAGVPRYTSLFDVMILCDRRVLAAVPAQ